MTLDREHAQAILDAHAAELKALGVRSYALFGSVARNQAGLDSDVDVLVDYDPNRPHSSWGCDVAIFLSDLFGRQVDVVDRAHLEPFLKDRIIAEAEGRFVTPTPPKSPRQPLADSLQNLDEVTSIPPGRTLADYEGDWIFRKAIERSVAVVFEASRRLPDALKQRHPGVDWRKLADIGNILRHMYHRIDNEVMWETIHDDLPKLREVVLDMIAHVEAAER